VGMGIIGEAFPPPLSCASELYWVSCDILSRAHVHLRQGELPCNDVSTLLSFFLSLGWRDCRCMLPR
jgi:hypothetical protein